MSNQLYTVSDYIDDMKKAGVKFVLQNGSVFEDVRACNDDLYNEARYKANAANITHAAIFDFIVECEVAA